MPCNIRCSACGFKFFNDREDVTSPADIMRRYSFRCPSCFKRLNFDPRNISIKVATTTFISKRNIALANRIRLEKTQDISN